MLAARVHAWGADPTVEEAHDPRPAEGETLVRVAAASLAHIDLTIASGEFPLRPPLPYVPGTEGAGTVVESASLPAGTPVRARGAGIGFTRDGLCAELAAVPDSAAVPLPDGTDLELAAAFFSPCVTAYAALHEVGELRPGERVAVTGAGGAVGSVAVQLAARGGASAVVAVTRDPERLRTASGAAGPSGAAEPSGSLGATAVVAASGPDTAAAVRSAASGGVDLLVDTVGGALLPALATGAVAPGGRVVLVGYAAGETATFPLPALLAADVRLLPMNLVRRGAGLEDRARQLLDELHRGELALPLTPLPLARIGEALRHIRDGTAAGRVVVTP
jgi:NADPH:quinone reductase